MTTRRYLRITHVVRRKKGVLIPIEWSLLAAALEARLRGELEFHGYAIAKVMRDREGARRLTAHGTLYRVLDRLEQAGFLRSRQEDPMLAAAEGRPRRRLFQLTAAGETAAAQAPADALAQRPALQIGAANP